MRTKEFFLRKQYLHIDSKVDFGLVCTEGENKEFEKGTYCLRRDDLVYKKSSSILANARLIFTFKSEVSDEDFKVCEDNLLNFASSEQGGTDTPQFDPSNITNLTASGTISANGLSISGSATTNVITNTGAITTGILSATGDCSVDGTIESKKSVIAPNIVSNTISAQNTLYFVEADVDNRFYGETQVPILEITEQEYTDPQNPVVFSILWRGERYKLTATKDELPHEDTSVNRSWGYVAFLEESTDVSEYYEKTFANPPVPSEFITINSVQVSINGHTETLHVSFPRGLLQHEDQMENPSYICYGNDSDDVFIVFNGRIEYPFISGRQGEVAIYVRKNPYGDLNVCKGTACNVRIAYTYSTIGESDDGTTGTPT